MVYDQKTIDINNREPKVGETVLVLGTKEHKLFKKYKPIWYWCIYIGNKTGVHSEDNKRFFVENIKKWIEFTPMFTEEEFSKINKGAVLYVEENIKTIPIGYWSIDYFKFDREQHKNLYCCDMDYLNENIKHLGVKLDRVTFAGTLFFDVIKL